MEWNYCPNCGHKVDKSKFLEDLKRVRDELMHEMDKYTTLKVKKILEPESHVYVRGDNKIYEIIMPGVKSRDDVDIRRIGESLEVRAIIGNKMYFKIINMPRDHYVVADDFEDNVLRLHVQQFD